MCVCVCGGGGVGVWGGRGARGGIAQWIECRTQKPGAILTRVRDPGAARDFLFIYCLFHSSQLSV